MINFVSLHSKLNPNLANYLAVGLPVTKKIGVGFGLIPYSSVGYKIESIAADATQNSSRFSGKGGLNKVFFGVGYKISSKWSFGADGSFQLARWSKVRI